MRIVLMIDINLLEDEYFLLFSDYTNIRILNFIKGKVIQFTVTSAYILYGTCIYYDVLGPMTTDFTEAGKD